MSETHDLPSRDPLVESLLTEMLTEHRPPDLSDRILSEARTRGLVRNESGEAAPLSSDRTLPESIHPEALEAAQEPLLRFGEHQSPAVRRSSLLARESLMWVSGCSVAALLLIAVLMTPRTGDVSTESHGIAIPNRTPVTSAAGADDTHATVKASPDWGEWSVSVDSLRQQAQDIRLRLKALESASTFFVSPSQSSDAQGREYQNIQVSPALQLEREGVALGPGVGSIRYGTSTVSLQKSGVFLYCGEQGEPREALRFLLDESDGEELVSEEWRTHPSGIRYLQVDHLLSRSLARKEQALLALAKSVGESGKMIELESIGVFHVQDSFDGTSGAYAMVVMPAAGTEQSKVAWRELFSGLVREFSTTPERGMAQATLERSAIPASLRALPSLALDVKAPDPVPEEYWATLLTEVKSLDIAEVEQCLMDLPLRVVTDSIRAGSTIPPLSRRAVRIKTSSDDAASKDGQRTIRRVQTIREETGRSDSRVNVPTELGPTRLLAFMLKGSSASSWTSQVESEALPSEPVANDSSSE